MSRVFTSGFELNSITDGMEFTTNNATVQIVTTNPRSGTYHGRVSGASNGFWRQNAWTSDQQNTGYIGVAICIHAAVNATTQLVRWSTVANALSCNISLTSSNTLVLLKANGTQVGSASAALSLDTWYYIELKSTYNISAAATTIEGRLNGSIFATGANSSTSVYARALIGIITGTQTTADVYFDDWKINDNQGGSETSYPGDGKVILLSPNAAGDNNAWLDTGGGAGSSNNYQLVDEKPPTDATDFVNSVTLNAEDFYNVAASGLSAGDTISLVQVGFRFNNNTADAVTAFRAEIKKASAGTILQSASIIPNSITWRTNSTAAPDVYALTAYTDPDAAAWTSTTLDSMQIGVKLTAAGTNRVQVSAMWAYVDYIPGAAPSPSTTTPAFLFNMI